MKYAVVLLMMMSCTAYALEIGEGVEIKVNESSGSYVINSTVYLEGLNINGTHANFSGLDFYNQSCFDVDTNDTLCEAGSECSLNYTESERNIIFSTAYGLDIDYVLGPAVSYIRFMNVSSDWAKLLTPPEGQTEELGIINATNTGTATGRFQIRLTNLLNDN